MPRGKKKKKKYRERTRKVIRVRILCECGAVTEPVFLTGAMLICGTCGHLLFGSGLTSKHVEHEKVTADQAMTRRPGQGVECV